MKRLMSIVALICAIVLQANAQMSVEDALKNAERLAKLADKNPKDGKKQLNACTAFYNDDLADKKNYERALYYGNRALQIATDNPAPKDTLMGLTCLSLCHIYMQMNNVQKSCDFIEKACDALTYELGRHDPVTNGTKVVLSSLMMNAQPFRAFPNVLSAFVDNDGSPQDKRIINMDEANIVEELAVELLISQYTQRYRYTLPMVFYKEKPYVMVQTNDWNMERPLVGWMAPSMMRTEAERQAFKGDDIILCDDQFNFVVVKDDDKDRPQIFYNYKHFINNPKQLVTNPGESRMIFFSPDRYNQTLEKYREFKNSLKK